MRAHLSDIKLAEEIDAIFPLCPEVKEAIGSISRAHFLGNGLKKYAYKIDALPIGDKQFISSPLTVAKMSEYIEHAGADSVLEIGCGSGYQAAVLSKLIRRVFSIERIGSLLREARDRIKSSGITNINTRLDDGLLGWREFAPYDRVLFSAATEHLPQSIIDQVSDGGIIVAPIKKGDKQFITRYYKHNNTLTQEILEECEFVPILNGKES
ncbi:MAG: protein-L-isoaspartate(D-aspartate) O-methyltransferase [Campylobacterales bacterium]